MRPVILISNLIDEHGNSYIGCPGCEICSEIKMLREKMNKKPDPHFQKILAKGQDMTTRDIELLVENEVHRESIRKALGMDLKSFYKMIKSLGLNARSMARKQKYGEELSEKRKQFTMPIDEYITLRYTEKRSYQFISTLKNVPIHTIVNWKKKNIEKIQKVIEKMGVYHAL